MTVGTTKGHRPTPRTRMRFEKYLNLYTCWNAWVALLAIPLTSPIGKSHNHAVVADWNGFPSSFRYDSRINFVQIGGLQHVASSSTLPLCAKHHENISVPQHSARSPEERSGFAAKGFLLERLWRNLIVTNSGLGQIKVAQCQHKLQSCPSVTKDAFIW